MKSIIRVYHANTEGEISFIKFEINRMNIRKFKKLSLEKKMNALEFYDDCIRSVQSFKDSLVTSLALEKNLPETKK